MSKKSKRVYDQEVRAMAVLGLKRAPLSGQLGKITFGDGITQDNKQHPRILADNKDRKKHAVWMLFDDVAKKAQKEGNKIPILTLTSPRKEGVLLVLNSKHWKIQETEMAKVGGETESIGFFFEYRGEHD